MRRASLHLIVLFLGGVTCAVAIRSCWRESRGQAGPSGRDPIQLPQSNGSMVDNSPRAGRETIQASRVDPESDVALKPARAILETYWGAAWPGMAEEAGNALDLNSRIPPPPDWNDVAAKFESEFVCSDARYDALRRRYLWPLPTTEDYVSNHYSTLGRELTAQDLLELEAKGMNYQSDLERLLDEYRDLLNYALRELWEQNRFRKGPLFLPEENQKRRVIACASHSIAQWAVTYCIYRDEFPDLDNKQKELEAIKRARRAEIDALIASW